METFVLATGMAAVAGGLGLAALGAGRALMARRSNPAVEMILDEGQGYRDDLDRPLAARLLGPALESFGQIGRALTPSWQLKRMRRSATLASFGRRGVEGVLALKAIAFVSGATLLPLGMAMLGARIGGVILWAMLGGLIGFFAPDVWIARRGEARQAQIRSALPEVLDLMAIAVQAGIGLEGSIELVSRKLPGALGDELHRLLQEIQLGASRRQALQALRDRTNVSELSTFALALIQADTVGSPVARVLGAHAAEMRMLRRQRAREKAAKLPVKLLFPLLLTIFPALMIIVIGPAVISIIKVFL
ncbi:MAG: type II secretion system F family protein [Actinomycetota bacterium]